MSYHEHNEASRTRSSSTGSSTGDRVVLVTDAGMPSVSDPGYRLVARRGRAGVPVTCVPGPSAVLMALAVSGMPVDRFCFEGFLPRKPGERARALAELREERRTMVFFEAPHRLAAMLAAMAEAFGPDRRGGGLPRADQDLRGGATGHPRRAGRVGRGAASGARSPSSSPVRAGGAARRWRRGPDHPERVAAGERLKDVCADVAAQTGLSKKALYDAALAAR